MDDRSLRIAVLLSAHLIFLSAAALRILRGQRAHQLIADAPLWIVLVAAGVVGVLIGWLVKHRRHRR